jgi:uncharacterized protein (TIGR02001 family)
MRIEREHRRGPIRLVAPAVLGAILGLQCAAAWAQVGYVAALASDYGARGASLSRGSPSPQLRVDVDSSEGWYAGAQLARVSLADSRATVNVVASGGYAARIAGGLSWEAGALATAFAPDNEYGYHEFYAGLAGERVGVRLYYSPSYYGAGKSLYAEAHAAYPLREHLTLSGHLGLAHPLAAASGGDRLDGRVALGLERDDWTLEAALVAGAHGPRRLPKARALAVSASHAF